MGAEIILRERYGQRAVGREVEFRIALAPVPLLLVSFAVYAVLMVEPGLLDDGDVDGSKRARAVYFVVCHCVCADVEKTVALELKSRRSTKGFNWLRLGTRTTRESLPHQ